MGNNLGYSCWVIIFCCVSECPVTWLVPQVPVLFVVQRVGTSSLFPPAPSISCHPELSLQLSLQLAHQATCTKYIPQHRHMKNKKIIRSSQHEFPKEEFMLDQFDNFFDKLAGLVEKGKSMNTDYLHFGKVSTLISMTSSQSCWCLSWMSREWGGLKTCRMISPRGYWSGAQS